MKSVVFARWVLAVSLVLGLGGCDMFKFKGQVTTVKTENGHTTVHRREVDKIEDMPGAVSEAADEMAEVTKKLIKKLTDVPPPGKVKLGDLGAGFKDFEGKKDFDFLIQAKEGEKTIEFEYVQSASPTTTSSSARRRRFTRSRTRRGRRSRACGCSARSCSTRTST